MPMPANDIVDMVMRGIPDAQVTITDLRGDQNHYAITVVSPSFSGLSRPAQHKRVYTALGHHVGTTIHALSITTQTEGSSHA
ncbi:MAG: BolA/IbaG family iron-sulfur metabolism protein [Alphaproteobacteria bacterium]|nr:MAG: BolA/IbaG family iron-sulfur metabolism protein [Alphaproteobacteria bacterium]